MTLPERQTVLQGATEVEISVSYPTEGLPRPEAANWFQLAAAGDEIQLSAGYLDPREIADVLAGTQSQAIVATVTHRFFLSRQAFSQLHAAVNQVGAMLDKQQGRRNP